MKKDREMERNISVYTMQVYVTKFNKNIIRRTEFLSVTVRAGMCVYKCVF